MYVCGYCGILGLFYPSQTTICSVRDKMLLFCSVNRILNQNIICGDYTQTLLKQIINIVFSSTYYEIL